MNDELKQLAEKLKWDGTRFEHITLYLVDLNDDELDEDPAQVEAEILKLGFERTGSLFKSDSDAYTHGIYEVEECIERGFNQLVSLDVDGDLVQFYRRKAT